MLKVENLSVSMDSRRVLKNISFEAQSAKICVITGANGSGKTTLLKAIMGLAKVECGKIFAGGIELSKKSVDERAKSGLSIAFQHPVPFKGITVRELLEIAAPRAKSLDEACECLSKVGLCARNYLDREFNTSLSGGERKRIEIAVAIAQNKDVMLFDEPESGIDMWSFDALVGLFSSLRADGKTVVIVSHNPQILQMADKVIVLRGGQIEYEGAPESLKGKLGTEKCKKLGGDA